MNILLLGAAGFIGTNLTRKLAEDQSNKITLVDQNESYFGTIHSMKLKNVRTIVSALCYNQNFDELIREQDVIYHLASTTVPTTSNRIISEELMGNVIFTANFLDACVRCRIKKVIFISSGGTVYGKEQGCPLNEETPTFPISSYGLQKITNEKLLYLYRHMYGLDYRVVRLANPYGPYQRPNGILGAITTFTYKALKREEITVYGDGSVVRDFIYIDDATRAIQKIAVGESEKRTFNVGSGRGVSINEVLDLIRELVNSNLNIIYKKGRSVDVPVNYLDISRYEGLYGSLETVSLREGIKKTAEFIKQTYQI